MSPPGWPVRGLLSRGTTIVAAPFATVEDPLWVLEKETPCCRGLVLVNIPAGAVTLVEDVVKV